MDAKVQRRIQRYGWDLAVDSYESSWQHQLAPAHAALLDQARFAPGERVLDVACGTGLVTFEAARQVGAGGSVVGIDISGEMVLAAAHTACERLAGNVHFQRMDAELLAFADASFDVVVCALGLMYMPEPEQALREMRRVLKPGGRLLLAVWGERARCGWSAVFPIVDAEVSSEVCPMFFRLGQGDALARACSDLQLAQVRLQRIAVPLDYADAQQACVAAFVGGPAALAWSRFADEVRARVCKRYVDAIGAFRNGDGFRVPGEFVLVSACR
jgi:ubiquinone/menaquinone biosynthesis C-methylase UbiE